jgi:predicted nucleic acid-binding protein
LSSDLDTALRWLKPQRHKVCPRRRSEKKLPWAEDEPLVGGPLMLDTSVYVDLLLGKTPDEVDRLIQIRTCDHSAVCLAELTHAFGRLDPKHPDTKVTLREIRRTVNEDIPPHRLHSPGPDVWRVAGILAGLVFRLRNLPKGCGHERKLLNDGLLYLQARKTGCTVLTRNLEDFDIMNQLVPSGRVLFYRRA